MSRILLTWELGLNVGHLTRLLPIAQRLKSEGHRVLVATRDILAAATVLGPAGIPFVQAPHLPQGIALAHRPAGYADILLSQGWSHLPSLLGLTHAWLNLFRLYNPERLVLDYSPTVSLAARIAQVPTVLVGNGFELPPPSEPLPPFPGFSWATTSRAETSEALAVSHANKVLQTCGSPDIKSLSELFARGTSLLATFPALDHYGARAGGRYIGPLLGKIPATRVDWPQASGPKIFACLRADTSHAQLILGALADMEAAVICVASGFTSAQLEPFKRSHIRFVFTPVDLDALKDASLCVTYGAEGTMLRFLLAGVPQLISPWHVETYMAARKIEAAGLGVALRDDSNLQSVKALITSLSLDTQLHERAAKFAQEVTPFEAENAVAVALVAKSDGTPITAEPPVKEAAA